MGTIQGRVYAGTAAEHRDLTLSGVTMRSAGVALERVYVLGTGVVFTWCLHGVYTLHGTHSSHVADPVFFARCSMVQSRRAASRSNEGGAVPSQVQTADSAFPIPMQACVSDEQRHRPPGSRGSQLQERTLSSYTVNNPKTPPTPQPLSAAALLPSATEPTNPTQPRPKQQKKIQDGQGKGKEQSRAPETNRAPREAPDLT
ncbi:hypothetical protein B2J93_7865 [Marssonina coronariae]|uniref:Uncharacterized protein n=1 Tax=Diplocarpon coronariae TaxID=2795749 RepID=A0A218ZBQ8_9HELO|nr:hypothetical protein B2J93_7865 [Marssonina coronariae]